MSHANPADPKVKQWLIRRVQGMSGRGHFADLYETWCNTMVGRSASVLGGMLDLIGIRLDLGGAAWPGGPGACAALAA